MAQNEPRNGQFEEAGVNRWQRHDHEMARPGNGTPKAITKRKDSQSILSKDPPNICFEKMVEKIDIF